MRGGTTHASPSIFCHGTRAPPRDDGVRVTPQNPYNSRDRERAPTPPRGRQSAHEASGDAKGSPRRSLDNSHSQLTLPLSRELRAQTTCAVLWRLRLVVSGARACAPTVTFSAPASTGYVGGTQGRRLVCSRGRGAHVPARGARAMAGCFGGFNSDT